MAKDVKLYNESNLTDTDRWEISMRYLRFCINLCFARIVDLTNEGKNPEDLVAEMHDLSSLRAFLKCIDTDSELIHILYEMENDPKYDKIMSLGWDKT